MNRVFSNLSVRTVDEDERVIEGIATTPRTDRAGDIVLSEGAEFDLPVPFLLDHDHRLAVGEVELAEVTSAGIRFRARIKKIAEPGEAKNLVDRAWSLIKNQLRKFVSIGFRPIEYENLPGGGVRYLTWEWLELSAVVVPAQPDARITGVKAARAGIGLQEARMRSLRADALQRSVEQGMTRKRLGIVPVVRLTSSDYANAKNREADRKNGEGVVRLGGPRGTGKVVKL